MYPAERSLVKEMQNRPFALIGVNSDADLEEIRGIVKEKELTWRSFWNGPMGPPGPIAQAWGIRGWPTVFLIDHEGVIRSKGHREPEHDLIEKLVAEAEAALK